MPHRELSMSPHHPVSHSPHLPVSPLPISAPPCAVFDAPLECFASSPPQKKECVRPCAVCFDAARAAPPAAESKRRFP